jgi:putative ABC transport system substrate-binding protein
MLKRLGFAGLILVTLLSLSACGDSDKESSDNQSKDSVKVGILSLLPTMETIVDGFKQGLADNGYVEGKNVTYIYSGPVGDPTRLDAAAAELVSQDVTLIFAVTTPAALAAQKAGADKKIPVVFAAVTDPVASGLAESLPAPGKNATGVTTAMPDMSNEGVRLDMLLKIAPDVHRVNIPYNPDNPTVLASLAAVQRTAEGLGVELVLVEVRTPEEAMAAAQNPPEDIDAIFLLADTVTVTAWDDFIATSLEKKLPLSSSNPVGPELMSYGSDFTELGKQSARLGSQVLGGASASDLPIEVPEFYLTINLETAQQIGLEVSDDALRLAHTIIRADAG